MILEKSPLYKKLSYQQLDILHSLRGFCAFYVVVYHAKYVLWSGGRQFMKAYPRANRGVTDYFLFALDMLSSAGYEMVIFFFVLSGFFIRYAQLRKQRPPLDFYINRIARIYPPYFFSAVLAAVSIGLVARSVPTVLDANANRELNTALISAWHELQNFSLAVIFRTLGFLPLDKEYIGYNTVFWSLLPEALFYLVVPLTFWRIKIYYILSVLLHIVGLWGINQAGANPIGNYLLTFNFYFAVGAMLYDVVVRTAWLYWFRRLSGWLIGTVLLALFAGLLVLAVLKLKALSGLVAVVLAALSVSALLAGKVSPRNLLMRVMHKLGVFSFSLYLYHFPLLILAYAGLVYLTGDLVFYARYYWLAVPVVTLVSYVLYWFTERASVNYFRKV